MPCSVFERMIKVQIVKGWKAGTLVAYCGPSRDP